jgi:predicted HAD superfamily Cof-like phosphohydrolase
MTAHQNEIFNRVIEWNRTRSNVVYSRELEYSMLLEELTEYKDARDELQELDAICDLAFVAIGTLYKFSERAGIDPVDAMRIVCNANDAKGMDKDKNGKIRKPLWFSKPDCENGPLDRLLKAGKANA